MFDLLLQVAYVAIALLGTPSPARADLASASLLQDSIGLVVDRIFADWDHPDSPGCAVAVSRGDVIIYERGYGVSDVLNGRRIDPSTVFQAGSVSKQFTAFAILLLARDGRLSLDTSVSHYLPEWPRSARAITIRHLLTHTSGLRDVGNLMWLADGAVNPTPSRREERQILARQHGLNFEPGSAYLYTNANYDVLATIVERISRQSFSSFTEQRIFRPIGMAHTRFEENRRVALPNRATGHDRKTGEPWIRWSGIVGATGASGLWTTVGDLLKWESNFEHPSVRDAALLRSMQENTIFAGGDSIGFGLIVGSYRGARLIGATGSNIGFRAYVGRIPEHRLAIAALCNANPARPLNLVLKVADAALGSSLAPETATTVQPIQAGAPTTTRLERYAGVFENAELNEVQWIRARSGRLFVAGGSPVAPRGARFPLQQLGEGRFSMLGDIIEFASGDTDRFERKGWNTVPFERRQEVTLRRDELTEYAGRYYSDEVRASKVVTANDSTLTFSVERAGGFSLAPSFRDAFDGRADLAGEGLYNLVTVKFQRDAAGRVSSFLLSTRSARRIRFIREEKTHSRRTD